MKAEFKLEDLEKNISNYHEKNGKFDNEGDNAVQHIILDQILKLRKDWTDVERVQLPIGEIK